MTVLKTLAAAIVAGGLMASAGTAGAQSYSFVGASQFGDEHPYNLTMIKFAELVNEYYGQPVEFTLRGNMQLGTEKDYFAYMSQGTSVDYAIVAPTDMATFSQMASFFDTPFLFRDLAHWEKVLTSDALRPVEEEILAKADVMVLGYSGGGVRNLISKEPVRNLEDLAGLNMRVMAAPIQSRIFAALGAAPTGLTYNELYNALQTGLVDAAENEANGIKQMKFYEVAPYVSLTQHSITVRQLVFSGKTFRSLPEDLQAAILRAGAEATAYGRQLEAGVDHAVLEEMANQGLVQVIEFTDRDKLLELAEPVKESYAHESGADEILQRINAIE